MRCPKCGRSLKVSFVPIVGSALKMYYSKKKEEYLGSNEQRKKQLIAK